jgi:hypothetical protein
VVSEEIVRHINYLDLEGDDINSKFYHLLEHEYCRRLTRYEYTDRMFQKKYGMSLKEFEEKDMVKKHNYSWEVESDLYDWEIAHDGIESMKRRLDELRRKDL